MKLTTFLFSTLLLASCGNSDAPPVTKHKPDLPNSAHELRQAMIGNWVGEAPLKQGGTRKWLVQRKSDGTYLIDFRIRPSGKAEERSQEVGSWGVSGPIYFSIMKGWVTENGVAPSDPTNPYFYDAYKIVSLNAEKFEYESFSSGNVFAVKKVSDSFTANDL